MTPLKNNLNKYVIGRWMVPWYGLSDFCSFFGQMLLYVSHVLILLKLIRFTWNVRVMKRERALSYIWNIFLTRQLFVLCVFSVLTTEVAAFNMCFDLLTLVTWVWLHFSNSELTISSYEDVFKPKMFSEEVRTMRETTKNRHTQEIGKRTFFCLSDEEFLSILLCNSVTTKKWLVVSS